MVLRGCLSRKTSFGPSLGLRQADTSKDALPPPRQTLPEQAGRGWQRPSSALSHPAWGSTGPAACGCAVLGKSPEPSEPIFSLCVSGDNLTAPEIRQGKGRLLQETLKIADTAGVWETLPTVSTYTVSLSQQRELSSEEVYKTGEKTIMLKHPPGVSVLGR